MFKFLEFLTPEEMKLMKFLIAHAKNSLIESRNKSTNKPNNNDVLNFAGDLLHEIIKIEKK